MFAEVLLGIIIIALIGLVIYYTYYIMWLSFVIGFWFKVILRLVLILIFLWAELARSSRAAQGLFLRLARTDAREPQRNPENTSSTEA